MIFFKTLFFGFLALIMCATLQSSQKPSPTMISSDQKLLLGNAKAEIKLMLLKKLCEQQHALQKIMVPFFLQHSSDQQNQLLPVIAPMIFNNFNFVSIQIVPGYVDYIDCHTNNPGLESALNATHSLTQELLSSLQFMQIKKDILEILHLLQIFPEFQNLEFHLLQQPTQQKISHLTQFGQSMIDELEIQAPTLAQKVKVLKNKAAASDSI
jgi:hypothetical protein